MNPNAPRPNDREPPRPSYGVPPRGTPVNEDGLSDAEFAQLRDLVYQKTGIELGEGKRVLLASRLFRRMNALGLKRYGDYYGRVIGDGSGVELQNLINAITTNKTDFFRESHHFDYLREAVFPRLRERVARGAPPRLRIWSAGCSTGEEPYSIAMTVLDALGANTAWDVRIIATDLDTQVLARAQSGVYGLDRVAPVPKALASRFLRPHAGGTDQVEVAAEARRIVSFQQLNFVQEPWPVQGPLDVIFFRNVAIYFDRPTQERILRRMLSLLDPEGDLVVGHSESLHWLSDAVTPVANTVYRKREAVGTPARRATPPPPMALQSPSAPGLAPPRVNAPPPRSAPPPPSRPAVAAPPAAAEPKVEVITVGGVFASREPRYVRTLLGSCIAACMWDPTAGIGGMNHFLLPDGGATGDGSSRFGVHAMELLINEIMKLGGDRRRLKAKVFGGGHVLRVKGFDSAVPQRNAEFVRAFLAREGIPIVGERLGGHNPLEVKFNTQDGRAFVRALEPAATADVARAEERFVSEAARAVAAPRTPDVELF